MKWEEGCEVVGLVSHKYGVVKIKFPIRTAMGKRKGENLSRLLVLCLTLPWPLCAHPAGWPSPYRHTDRIEHGHPLVVLSLG